MEVGESRCLTPPNGGEWAASHWGHLDSPGLIPGPRPAPLSIALAAMTLCVGTGAPLQQVQWAIGWILGPGVGAPSVGALVRTAQPRDRLRPTGPNKNKLLLALGVLHGLGHKARR